MLSRWRQTAAQLGALSLLWILFSAVVGFFFAGYIAYGPLHLDLWISMALGLVIGLLYGGLWVRQQVAARQGQQSKAKRLRTGLILTPTLMGLSMITVSGVQLYQVGQFPPLREDRMANFERLWRAVDANYPYFELKGVDWDEVYVRYRPALAQAATDDEYHALLAQMLAELNDGHTQLRTPRPQPRYRFGHATYIEDQVVITGVDDAAQQAGLSVGDVVNAINGQPVDAYMANLDPRLRLGSTERGAHASALYNLLVLFAPADALTVTVETAAGEKRTVALRVPDPLPDFGGGGPLITGARLPSGFGLIEMGPFFADTQVHDVVAEFDAALADLADASGLILDLRRNGGGNSTLAADMAGRLLDEPFTYGRESYRRRLPTRAWWLWGERTVTPRPPIYAGPVVLLVDDFNVSTAEEFIVALVDSGRAQTVGRRTGGSTGNPLVFQLPDDAAAQFSSGDFRRMDGTPIEAVGIAPDVPVQWTLEDVRQGRDPDVAAAEQLLRQAVGGSRTPVKSPTASNPTSFISLRRQP